MSTVLITGCSSGFGELAALTFADHGHRVYATMRAPGKSAALNARADIHQFELDVTDSTSVNAAVEHVTAEAGPIDILVNNAGIEVYGPIHLLADDEITQQLDTNVTGVIRVVRAVVPSMLANGGGTIVTVGSVAGLVGTPYGGIYAASKHAVEAISEALHFELSQDGIRVRVVEPGQFATNLGANGVFAAAMTSDTPEFQRRERFHVAQRSLVNGEPAPAQRVADVIYQAATEQPGRLRYPVGDDAELIIATKSQMSFEDFDTTMRAALNWYE
ncbi:MAG TPA: SDR family oxidoreductase [Ilumatobacteraceae bacterium]|nr:SDR family oxidoreductase [Ilumatobacteraceae bacterium]